MGWKPTEFWSVTVTEYFEAVSVFNEMHADPDKTEAPTDDEMASLLERYG